MRHALSLARRGVGRTAPNPAVGCVIVKNGVVVGRGWTADGGRPHAEPIALEQAGAAAKGASVYVSLEPCNHQGKTPPCSGALIEAGVRRVVVACIDPDPRTAGQGIETLKAAGIKVDVGVLEQEALALNAGFILRVTEGRPFVTCKLAVSADGKIAAAPGQRTQITGALAGRYTHLLRSQHDAVLVGAETACVDEPLLTTRIEGYEHQSVRVVLDGGVCLPEETIDVDPHDLKAVLGALAARDVTRLLVEGGARVHTSFLEAGLCDQFYLFRAPQEIGASGVDGLAGHDVLNIAAVFDLEQQKTISLFRDKGEDLLEIYVRKA